MVGQMWHEGAHTFAHLYITAKVHSLWWGYALCHTHSGLLILHPALAKLYLLNIPANEFCQLNERAEKRCHFNVFPHECITELLSQTIANRDGQIEVVTQERQMRDRNRRDKKAWEGRGLGCLTFQYSVVLWRREEIESKERRGVSSGLVLETAWVVVFKKEWTIVKVKE